MQVSVLNFRFVIFSDCLAKLKFCEFQDNIIATIEIFLHANKGFNALNFV